MTDQSTSPVEGADVSSSEVDDGSVVIEGNDDFAQFEESLNAQPDEGQGDHEDSSENGDASDQDEEGGGDADLEDVEFEGKTYRLPRDIKDSLLRHADYTRKTQEVAEQRKATEQRLQRLGEIEQMDQLEQTASGYLTNLSQQIQQIENIDLASMAHTDPVRAQQLSLQLQKLTRDRGRLETELEGHRTQRSQKVNQEIEAAREEGRNTLRKKIKGYTPELESKLADFGTEYGFERDEIIEAVADPRSIEILHLAMLGKKALSQLKSTQKHTQASKTRPANALRGGGGKFEAAPDTSDFAAFERMAEKHLG